MHLVREDVSMASVKIVVDVATVREDGCHKFATPSLRRGSFNSHRVLT